MTGERRRKGEGRLDVPVDIVAAIRVICAGLPEAYEERAWVGARWRIRKRTFAHVLVIADGWPPAYARAAGTGGPSCVLTFRSSDPELQALVHAGHPFFVPRWWPDIIGMVLDEAVDWTEVGELLSESYRLLAPKRLVEFLEPPSAR
jgi:hypothetical protein